MADRPYFTPATFRFLKDLKENNDRAWFEDNRGRYEDHVKVPALRLIQDFAPLLHDISPHFQATPRSLFRIHRDVRFSKDKSPYKTHTGIQFRHEGGRDAHAPGFYLHVEPRGCFAGVGMWRPDGPTVRKVRARMVEKPDAWRAAVGSDAFRDTFELDGERLTRAPRGVDPDHPLLDDLKWKDFVGTRTLPQSFLTGPDLPEELARTYAAGAPLMRFLCVAVGAPFDGASA